MTDERIKETLAGWEEGCDGEYQLRQVVTEAEAPLLAACKAMVDQLGCSEKFDVVIKAGEDPYSVKLGRAAIAKAEGKL